MAAAAFLVWHGLGPKLGPRAKPNRAALAATLIALGALVIGMSACSAAMR